jgi:lipopolysaccharide/colanic/teichoic acid biosynthesis glycosyltransferase
LAFVPNQSSESGLWTEYANIDGTMFNLVGQPTKNWRYDFSKRVFDLFASLGLILVLLPISLAICLMVKLDSHGPIFFKQQRVGRDGKIFWLYKFRSMHVDAPKYTFSPTDSRDTRITRAGRFLRKTSMDELPQLINVAKGEMSLVGPRPEMPFIVAKYNAQQRLRLSVLPGLTGLWQLSADRAFLIHENIQYDLYYIRNRSLFMDVAILLHTAFFAMNGV